jgi:hypothetical protein
VAAGDDWSDWFVAGWPRVGLACAVVLALLLPALWTPDSAPSVLAASALPMYMIHQVEEHGRGRFVPWFNATVGGGWPVLTARSACWINVAGVWALVLLALLLARWAWTGFLLVPVWLVLVNGAIHVLGAVRERAANPGLVTGAGLFLPWGGAAAVLLSGGLPDAPLAHAVGFGTAAAVHAGIAAYALRRRARLAPLAPATGRS